MSDQPAAERKLGHPQLAFVRSWAEGLDLASAWDRYLYVDGAADARRARGELQRLLEALGRLARAHGRPEVAALLRRDPQAIAERGGDQPTLDEFRDQQPPDFYSEAELIALYQASHGALDSRSAARRRERLRDRILAAIQWLEGLVARQPSPADPVGAWLDERVAARLAAVGIQRLSDLTALIASKGFNWHRAVPKIGPEGARRIVRWLREQSVALGALPSPALQARALVDTRGNLVGINTAIYTRTGGSAGIGFAIPVSLARDVMDQIIANGSVTRGWIGVEMQELTPELVEAFNLREARGALVAGIIRNGPADQAGMRPGDIITAVSGRAVDSQRNVIESIARLKPGVEAKLKIRRGNQDVELDVGIGKRPTPRGVKE